MGFVLRNNVENCCTFKTFKKNVGEMFKRFPNLWNSKPILSNFLGTMK